MKAPLALMVLLALTPTGGFGQIHVSDSFTDGGRTDGADPLDTNWWTSTHAGAIEVSPGTLGLVNGNGVNGSGIHGVFSPSTLAVGSKLTVTFTFTTPATIGTSRSAALRIGLFDSLGRGGLSGDLSASEVSPNLLYNGLPGYWADWDVDATNSNITFMQHVTSVTNGQLLADTTAYAMIAAPGGAVYSFSSNTTYTGVFSLTRTGADSMELFASMSRGGTLMSSHSATVAGGVVSSLGMVAFHLSSSAFGSSTTPGAADNGIDFSNITVATSAIPEPSTSALLFGLIGLGVAWLRRRD